MSRYVLDTSALLAYIEDEEGANIIENIFMEALMEQHTLYRGLLYLLS